MIILERFEEQFAVLEINGELKNVSRDMLADNIPQGSVLKLVNGRYFADNEATEKRRSEIAALQDSLFE